MAVPAKSVPGVSTMMGPIEEALIETLFPAIFRREEVDANFWKILVHSVNSGRIVIPYPQ